MLHILLTLIVAGFILYLIDQIRMDATIKQIVRVVFILFILIWLIQMLTGRLVW